MLNLLSYAARAVCLARHRRHGDHTRVSVRPGFAKSFRANIRTSYSRQSWSRPWLGTSRSAASGRVSWREMRRSRCGAQAISAGPACRSSTRTSHHVFPSVFVVAVESLDDDVLLRLAVRREHVPDIEMTAGDAVVTSLLFSELGQDGRESLVECRGVPS